MHLASGTRLGPYEIVASLGSGGMGEVYRARDERLGREVAVKVLPSRLSQDPEARERFEREARAVAALSHPGILAIHDFGWAEGSAYAAMELLDGRTLRDLVREGPLSPRKVADYGAQIARALAAAHERGVIHRDVKPENVVLSGDGRVKILDFGLARQASRAAGSDTSSPTAPRHTAPGYVMGTAAYMAPEQARGQEADHRVDIFALGATLYELLTGTPAFQRGTVAESLAAILRDDPPEPPASAPPALVRVIRRCLEKQPGERFQSADDLAFALESAMETGAVEVASTGTMPRLPRVGGRLPAGALAAAALLLGGMGGAALQARLFPRPDEVPIALRPVTHSGTDSTPAASPDGRTIAFVSERDGRRRIWVKQLGSGAEVALTSGVDDRPRFSPDGAQVLFVRQDGARSTLLRVPVLGGEPRRVIEDATDGDWSPDGQGIVFLRLATESGQRVSTVWLAGADGSAPRRIARFPGQVLRGPRFSPDGATIAVVDTGLGNAARGITLVSAADGSWRPVVTRDRGSPVSVAWTAPGALLFSQQVRGGGGRIVLQGVPDGRTRTLLWLPTGGGALDVLGDGRLLLDSAQARENLRLIPLGLPAAGPSSERWITRGASADRQPVFSPDGSTVLFTSNRSGNLDIWALTLATGAVRRLTEHEAEDWDPALTRDGQVLLWSSGRGGHLEIWAARADGSGARPVSRDGVDAENPSATPDGWVVYRSGNPERAGIWKVRLDGTGAARLVAGTAALPEVSPDGRWVLYLAAVGEGEVIRVVSVADGSEAPFEIAVGPRLTGPVRIGRARWMPDGKAIAFVSQDERGVYGVFAQDFAPGTDTARSRRRLGGFLTDSAAESFAIAPDGRALVVAGWEQLFSVMTADGVPAVRSPRSNKQ